MGILGRRLLASIAFLSASLATSGCSEDDECSKRVCLHSQSDKPTSPLGLEVQVSGGWDSVWIEVHAGDAVENSPRYASWSGADARTLPVGEGSWSGHAVYIRPGDTLDTYDADETSWTEETDECGCFEDWTPGNGHLDLRTR